ncbi:hypothetical protein [Flavobacterium sp. NRK1]|nr:hypothetical protein [Flavobacterium sp. NRK1]
MDQQTLCYDVRLIALECERRMLLDEISQLLLFISFSSQNIIY